jgi:hypothetical protein
MDLMTVEEFQGALPRGLRGKVSQGVIDSVNTAIADPTASRQLRENIIGYSHVLREGKWSMPEYINAVNYVSYKLMDVTNQEAFVKTFPSKYAKWKFLGVEPKTISRYVTGFHKSKLVTLLLQQTLVPTHLLNADLYQQALNQQGWLMMNAKSEKVQSDAANSLMTALRPPETKKIELDIALKEDKTIDDLRVSTAKLVEQQRVMLAAGQVTALDIAHSTIIEGEISE